MAADTGGSDRPGVVVPTAMRYRLNRYTIPRMLRRHRVGFVVGLCYGIISALVLAGAVQTAIHAARPGVSLAGELTWHVGVAVAILVGLAGLAVSIGWVGVTQYEVAEARRRRIAQERGLEEPLALWRVRARAPVPRGPGWRQQRRRHPHHAHRRHGGK